ncbi:Glycosyl hydrolase family 38 C-terminal [Trinorchestia longiramus]|nr:Glycosyl hydrolase family 38 C-terminal [Trinorchestia longiramus]
MSDGSFILSNGLVRAVISSNGQLTSLTADGVSDRDVFLTAGGDQLTGNRILLYDDQPLYWDAWDVMDYHLETETCLNDTTVSTLVSVKEQGSLRSSLSWGCSVGRSSSLLQEISLSADCPYVTFQTSVSWAENRKLLKSYPALGSSADETCLTRSSPSDQTCLTRSSPSDQTCLSRSSPSDQTCLSQSSPSDQTCLTRSSPSDQTCLTRSSPSDQTCLTRSSPSDQTCLTLGSYL